MNKDSTGLLYTLFADLLSYPSQDLFSITETCLGEVRGVHPDAVEELKAFQNGIQNLSVEKIEELYTVTFDMQPVCYPYAGYQLFGESYKRGAFMAQLNEAYHAFGYSAGGELPDHLAVILRFLGLDAANRQGEFCQTLLVQGLIPALEKMLKAFAESQNPYVGLLKALQLVLTHTPEKEMSHA
ncbi:MAG: nitrate reductase [Chloroflexi bacterium]|nr:nitrate reductase [Chloroflexota bacterium]MDL1943251.1 nitrate reductase [Chloroflexi bacterium CFX2]